MIALLRHPSTWLAASALTAVALLLLGPTDWVEARLPGGLPVGNALVVVALVNAALSGCVYSVSGSVLRLLSTAALMLGVSWVPVSLAISGNLASNFHGHDAGYLLWLRFTAVAALLAFATLVATAAAAIASQRRTPTG